MSMSVAIRQAVERRVIRAAVKGLLAAGYFITVNDGEEDTVKRSRDLKQIMAALMTTDEDWLKVYPPDGSTELRCGWVRLVYGNDGWDVICDNTVNLEPALAAASELTDKLSQ